ncbi:MAG: AsmA family protein [Desulfovibrio sp.]|jgi:AsmA protein|nr:AsmA family protein [Desulfovibrio sp.]
MFPSRILPLASTLARRLLFRILLPLAGLAALSAALFYLLCVFKSDFLAAALEQRLRADTLLPWRIAGPVRPEFFPLPGLRVDNVQILAASLEQESGALFLPPLLSVPRLYISLDPLELLSARLRLSHVELDSPAITLALDKNGLPLWLPPAAPSVSRPEEDLHPTRRFLAEAADFLSRGGYSDLPSLSVRDADIIRLDAAGSVSLSLRGIDLALSPRSPKELITCQARFALPPARLSATFTASLGLEDASPRLSGRLTGSFQMTPPGSRAVKGAISSLASWRGGEDSLLLPEFHFQAEGDELAADLQLHLVEETLSGSLRVGHFSLPRWFLFARKLPSGLQTILHDISGTLDISASPRGIRGDNLRMASGSLALSGSIACPDFSLPVVETDLLVKDAVNLDAVFPFLAVADDTPAEAEAPVFSLPPLIPFPGLAADEGHDVGYDVRLRLDQPLAHRLRPGPLELRIFPLKGDPTRITLSCRDILGGELEGRLDIARQKVLMYYAVKNMDLDGLPENQGNSVRALGRVSGSVNLDIPVDKDGHWADDWQLTADASIASLKILGGRAKTSWWLNSRQASVQGKGPLHTVRRNGISLAGIWNISLEEIRTSWFPEGKDSLATVFTGALAWPSSAEDGGNTNPKRRGVKRIYGAINATGSLVAPLGSERVPLSGTLNASMDWNLFQDNLVLDQIAFEGLGSFVGGRLALDATGPELAVTAPVNFKLAPRVLLEAWKLLPAGGIRMPALCTGSAQVSATPDKVIFSQLKIQVDGDPLQGQNEVGGDRQTPRAADKKPEPAKGSHWVFRLSSDRLNLDTFFPPAAPEERDTPPSTQPWDLSFLANLSLDGELAAKTAKFHGLNAGGSRTVATLQRGRFSLRSESSDFYGGSAIALIQGAFVPEQSQMHISRLLGEMRGFALGRAIQDSTGANAYGGTADVVFDLSGTMRSNADLYAGLSGIWNLKIANGVYPAFLGSETAGLRNTFGQASAEGEMSKGVLKFDNFRLSGMLVDMAGGGWVDLAGRTLDIRISVTIAKVPTVPVRFYGRLSSPSMYLRGASMVFDTAQAAGNTVFSLLLGILELPARALNGLGDALGGGGNK